MSNLDPKKVWSYNERVWACARIAELEGDLKKMKEYFHKPQHGSCCTCQKCGHIYDECRCDFDETYDENDILTARNAELEAFVNRLIEAGNTIVFETFEGRRKTFANKRRQGKTSGRDQRTLGQVQWTDSGQHSETNSRAKHKASQELS